MFSLLWAPFLFAVLVSIAEAMNYCSRRLCSEGGIHIGCGNSGKVKDQCGPNPNWVDIDVFHDNVLRKHNDFRNEIAKGNFHGFAIAGRMATMQWDKNLQRISEFSLLECKLNKHECIATNQFLKPGQNMAYNKFKFPQPTKAVINAQHFMWIDEYRYANMESLLTGKSDHGHEIGHFLQIVSDSADRIGCGFLKMEKDYWFYQFIACTYSVRFEKNKIAYKPGKTPGEDCKTGTNPNYTNLCSTSEQYEKDYKDNDSDTDDKKKPPSDPKHTTPKQAKPISTTPKQTDTDKDTSGSISESKTDASGSISESKSGSSSSPGKSAKGKSGGKVMDNVLDWLKQVDPNTGILLDVTHTNIKKTQNNSLILNIANNNNQNKRRERPN